MADFPFPRPIAQEHRSPIFCRPRGHGQGAIPDDEAPRFFLRDRESIYSEVLRQRGKPMHVEEVVITFRPRWQSLHVERIIGSVRRECLDDVIVLRSHHLHLLAASTSANSPLHTRASARTVFSGTTASVDVSPSVTVGPQSSSTKRERDRHAHGSECGSKIDLTNRRQTHTLLDVEVARNGERRQHTSGRSCPICRYFVLSPRETPYCDGRPCGAGERGTCRELRRPRASPVFVREVGALRPFGGGMHIKR